MSNQLTRANSLRKTFALPFAFAIAICLATAISLCGLFAAPDSAHAIQKKQSVKTLKFGNTYKSYDITGNKKADRIQLTTTLFRQGNSYSIDDVIRQTFVINGKTALVIDDKGSGHNSIFGVYLATLKNGKKFLVTASSYRTAQLGSNIYFTFYRYKSGKLKKIGSKKWTGSTTQKTVQNIIPIYSHGPSKVSVKGNYIKTTVTYDAPNSSLKKVVRSQKFRYKSGKIKAYGKRTSKVYF